jgi:hypothetical protein
MTDTIIMPNPYKDGLDIITVRISGLQEAWLDSKTGRIVQFGPAAVSAPSERKTVAELRAIARAIAAATVGDLTRLHPMEDNRRKETFYFRWDDFTSAVSEDELPPFFQVALNADGSLVGLTDTVNLYR